MRYSDEIASWLGTDGAEKLILRADLGRTTGIIATRGGGIVESTGVKVVLIPTNRGGGWQVLTAYPD